MRCAGSEVRAAQPQDLKTNQLIAEDKLCAERKKRFEVLDSREVAHGLR
jgi:hypothetical protein